MALASVSLCGLVANLNFGSLSKDSFSSRIHAYAKTISAINRFDPFEATMVVHENTKHSIERRIDWSENWLQWGLGQVYDPLSKTQNTNRLISAGLADCSERAQILKSIAEQAGCECRFVGLGGHVVLEIQTENGPCIADPDYGCLYANGLEDWVQKSNSKEIYTGLRKLGYPKAVISNYIDTIQSTDNNVSLDPGAPLSPRLYAIEQACSYLIWLIPIGFFAIGCLLVQKQK